MCERNKRLRELVERIHSAADGTQFFPFFPSNYRLVVPIILSAFVLGIDAVNIQQIVLY